MGPTRRALHSAWLLAVGAVALTSCAYVGQRVFEKKRDSLDQDQDGALFGGADNDCDDNNADKFPGNVETPYDGMDNDCDGFEMVDADGDGYPGILKADYEALNPEEPWPQDVKEGPLDCVDDPNANPIAAQIYPTNPNDPPYDGVDSDCGHDNDFDNDHDGYTPDVYADAYDQYIAAWGYDDLGAAKLGDCNDFRDDIYPGAGPDAWYDGDDTDCAGNNDFDADEDGYMPDRAANETAFTSFLQLYHGGVAPWTADWEDCLDQNAPPPLDQLNPASVYPGANDLPYDGIDGDCACDDDYDYDGDGAIPDIAGTPGDPANYYGITLTEYETIWGCAVSTQAGDCDDYDPNSHPGALELLGDAQDGDCDGAIDGTPFGFDAVLWENPRPPRLGRTDYHYVLANSTDLFDYQGLGDNLVGTGLTFPLTAGYDAQMTGSVLMWLGATNPLPLGGAIDLVTLPDMWWCGTGYVIPGFAGYVAAKQMIYQPLTQGYSGAVLEYDDANEYTGVATDLIVDPVGHPWVVGCGENTAQALRGNGISSDPSTTQAYIAPSITNPAGLPTDVCFWKGEPDLSTGIATAVFCDAGVDCAEYTFDSEAFPTATLTLAPTNDWAGRQLDYGNYREGWYILLETNRPGAVVSTGPGADIPVLTSWDVTSVDAHWRDINGDGLVDAMYVAAIAEPIPDDGLGPRVVLGWGDIGTPLNETVLPYDDAARPDAVPEGVGIFTDDDRLFIGVSANSPTYMGDSVGWVFFGWP